MNNRTFLSVLTLAILLFSSSCASLNNLGDFQRRLSNGIEEECSHRAVCQIQLGSFTNFRWDTLYVFDAGEDEEIIAKALGQPFVGWEEMTVYEVFLSAGKIVHQEHFEAGVENPNSREVVFHHADDKQFSTWTPYQWVAARMENGAHTYFTVGGSPQ